MSTDTNSLIERIAVIETRCELLPEIRTELAAVRADLFALKARVAVVAATVSLLVTGAFKFVPLLIR